MYLNDWYIEKITSGPLDGWFIALVITFTLGTFVGAIIRGNMEDI